MNRKRNVAYIKPEDPEFLKVLKREAGYDERNHKFDELDKDFVDDDDCEQPQVVVLQKGDLTAEEAEEERKKLEKLESEKKADLNERVIFKSKNDTESDIPKKRKLKNKSDKVNNKKTRQLLSFDDEEDDDNT